MKKITVAALVGLGMASTPTIAADLFGTVPAFGVPELSSPMAEVGSNWYIRGDIGVGWDNSPTVVPSAGLIPPVLFDTPGTGAAYTNTPNGAAGADTSVTRGFNMNSQDAQFDLGFGYRVNDYLRVDATWSFWRGASLGYSQATLCPGTTTPVSNIGAAGATPAGYLWQPVGCNGNIKATQFNNLGLASAYIDLGTYWGLTPYVGGGAGLNANTISGNTTFFNTSDGSPFLGNTTAAAGPPLQWVTQTGTTAAGAPIYTPLTHQPNVTFGQQNWNRSFSSTKYTMAGALMAGFSYPLSPSAMLDIGYRYISADLFGSAKNTSQQVHVGVRYMAN